MKKTFFYFILPSLLVLISILTYLIVFSYSDHRFQSIPEQHHFLVFLLVLGIFACGSLLFFSWKYIYKTADDLKVISSVAKKFNDGSFSQRFSYDNSATYELEQLRKTMNNLVSKIEKRVVSLQLQVSEKMAVLSSMSEAVIAVNYNEKVYLYNKAAEKLFNNKMEDKGVNELAYLVRIPEIYKILSESLESKKIIDKTIYVKDVYFGKEFKNIYIMIRSALIYNRRNKVNGMVFVIKDITKVKQLEKHRTDFVANVSHELKTPLTLIQGFSETLVSKKEISADERNKYLDIIHRHSSRLGSLINDLLAISRLENDTENEIDLDYGEVAIVVKRSVDLCIEKAQEKDLQIKFTDKSDNGSMKLNSSLLEQAVINLIENAIKHSSEEKLIDVSVFKKDTQLCIEVRDQGCGMDAHHLDRLFERFYRVDKGRSRDAGGTGLGLSIVKHVVQLHGGQVSVESKLKEGSVFRMIFPIEELN